MENLILPIVLAVFASQGLWGLILYLVQRKDTKKDKEDVGLKHQSQMLLGLGHDRIIYLGTKYIEDGFVTEDEFENLNKYLYEPYKKLGGNGTAEKIMDDVRSLPIRKNKRKERKGEYHDKLENQNQEQELLDCTDSCNPASDSGSWTGLWLSD